MSHQKIKQYFPHPVHLVSSVISEFTCSGTDLARNRKFPADKLITLLASQSSFDMENELLDLFDIDPQSPTASALNQQRVKLSLDVLEAVFRHFSHFVSFYDQEKLRCRFFAADGSTFTFFSRPVFALEEHHVSGGYSIRGFYSMHLNVFHDLQKHTYSDALIQLIHQKDKLSALYEMIDRHDLLTGTKDVPTGDRGCCSYSNMVHTKEKGQYFLFHVKGIHSKGLVGNSEFPDIDSFDIQVNVILIRSHKKRISIKEGYYKRFVDAAASLDYVAYGSLDTYDLSFRIVRFPISGDSYECIVISLPPDELPSGQIKLPYYAG